MRIAIIGNAEPDDNYSHAIDSSDIVIRFNVAYYFNTGLTGNKATIHAFVNAEPAAFSIAKATIPETVLSANTIWWTSTDKKMADLIIDAHKLHDKKFVDYQIDYELITMINTMAGQRMTPSSGIKVIHKCLREYQDTNISLYCFTWNGTYHHPWDIEKELCHKWHQEGKLRIV